jgi:predicted peptidase
MSVPFAVLLLFSVCLCRGVRAEDPKPGRQVAHVFQHGKSSESKLGYLLYLPKNHGQANERFPLLLFLHGSGERGNDISQVKKHGPPKLLGQGQHLPFVVVSPQCPAEQRWEPATLLALLDDIGSKYAIDPARVYVTGLSMGGFGTWELIATAPERFAAAVPICGHAAPWMAAPASRLPVWIVVGDRDAHMLAGNSLGMADALQARGADVKLTVLRGVGHDSWTQTYAMPELYEWLLRHRKGD